MIHIKKRTHEEYVQELKEVHPDIEVIGEYVDANTKIMHHCLKHDVYWETTPTRALNGIGCKMCMQEHDSEWHSKSHDEYVEEVKAVSPHIEVMEKYAGAKTPILHKCLIHNIEWKAMPTNILKGCGCPKCRIDNTTSATRKTQEEYVEEVSEIAPDIIVCGEYVNANTPILHKCKICGYEWDARPANILSGKSCPKCTGNMKKTTEEYKDKVLSLNPNIEVMGEYVNVNTPILHKCRVCGYEWETTPASIFAGSGCPKCSNRIKRTPEEYVKDVAKINPDIEVLEEFAGLKTPILHRCKKHDYTWEALPSTILDGGGCPLCYESKGERQIRQWLEKNNIEYIYQYSFPDCRDKQPLPFDFFVPSYNLCIEYDGEQHYYPVFGDKAFTNTALHDGMKNNYCAWNNINLLRIPYSHNVNEDLDKYIKQF